MLLHDFCIAIKELAVSQWSVRPVAMVTKLVLTRCVILFPLTGGGGGQ